MIRVGVGVTALTKAQTGGAHDGISHYTQELLKGLAASSNLECLPFSFSHVTPGATASTQSVRHLEPTLSLKTYPTMAAWSALSGQDYVGINRLAKRVDLIHATDHYIPKCSSLPVIATLMDAIPLSNPEWSSSSFRTLKNALWLKAMGWADQILTISEYSKSELTKWAGIDPRKIEVIPLGVDQRWFNPIAQDIFDQVRAAYQLPATFFIAVGTLQPRKNIAATIQAHKTLSQTHRKKFPLVIVGRPGWKCDEVVALIKQESVSGSVHWLQQVPDQHLLAIMKLAQGLVFASLAEGFGLPVLEAFAAQVPVITSNTSSLPEVAGDAAIGVDPTDISAIGVAMRQLIEDEPLRQTLKQRGLLRAGQFSWDTCSRKTVKAYKNILGVND